jgi:hypothetical protein
MNWFAAHGDKLLAGLGVVGAGLAQAGVSSPYLGVGLGILSALHTMFWPSAPQETPR